MKNLARKIEISPVTNNSNEIKEKTILSVTGEIGAVILIFILNYSSNEGSFSLAIKKGNYYELLQKDFFERFACLIDRELKEDTMTMEQLYNLITKHESIFLELEELYTAYLVNTKKISYDST